MFLELLRKFIFAIVSLFYVTGITWQHDSFVYCSFRLQHYRCCYYYKDDDYSSFVKVTTATKYLNITVPIYIDLLSFVITTTDKNQFANPKHMHVQKTNKVSHYVCLAPGINTIRFYTSLCTKNENETTFTE